METIVINDLQDLTHLNWRTGKSSPGTPGMLMKAEDMIHGKHVYYKLSRFDAREGIIGYESVNEYIADRILAFAGIDHLHYQLINAKIVIDDCEYQTYLCASEDFRRRNELKIPFETYFETQRRYGETVTAFCARIGLEDSLYRMLTADYLLLNRDRHGANIEILEDTGINTIRFAPLYDHGFSLLAAASGKKDIDAFDIREDKRVQSIVGGASTEKNLDLIPAEKMIMIPEQVDWDALFAEVRFTAPDYWISKTKELASYRWKTYEDIYHQRQDASGR